MEVTVFQTSDAFNYYEMLQITAETARTLCWRQSLTYESFVGIRKGRQAWHSTYNRIPYLREKLNEGYRGWVLHLDADAFVQDPDFDVRSYLAERSRFALIGAPSGASDNFWDINIGVFFLNLAHPTTQDLIIYWSDYLARYDLKNDTSAWSVAFADDQAMVHEYLSQRPETEQHLLLEPWEFMNAPQASFVRQLMRHPSVTFEQRVQNIRDQVGEVMRNLAPHGA